MSFGKRGNTDPNRPRPQMVAGGDANSSGSDNGPFIALVAGVFLMAAILAIFAPSAMAVLSSTFSGSPKPIAELVENMSRQDAIKVLRTEALPDKHGRAFLTALERHHPLAHEDLMGEYADLAQFGGTRDELVVATNEWSTLFILDRFPEIARSGARGFDFALDTVDMGIDVISDIGPGACNLPDLVQYAEMFVDNPELLESAVGYDSKIYRANMKYSVEFIELAAYGAKQPLPEIEALTREDMRAIQKVGTSIMRKGWFRELSRMNLSPNSVPNAADLPDVNICRISSGLVSSLRSLPKGTKDRLMAYAAQGLDGLSGASLMQAIERRDASAFGGFSPL